LQQKTFYKILVEFSLNPGRAKQYLSDKRLTLIEKKIIEGHLLIRNNQNQQALESMKLLSRSDLPFVEAQRKLLMGHALNNLSFFNESEKTIHESLEILNNFEAPYFQFVANYLLFTVYSNQNRPDLMLETLQRLESFPLMSEGQTIKLLRCKFDYYSLVDNEMAHKILDEIEPNKKDMSEGDIISQLVCEFMFYVKCEDLDKCEEVLKDMKNYRKFHITENFNFMKKLLSHLKVNAPIYLYGEDFKSTPMLYFQLKVIQSFEENNFSEVDNSWARLQNLYPGIYLPNYTYAGPKCLFSLCLEKHRGSAIETKIGLAKGEGLSQLDILVELLRSSHSPLSKNYIYEYIWNESPEDKEHFKKLTRLISRARSEKGIEIKSRKGTYYIDSLPLQKNKAS
jgi:hypothetical protein